MKEIGIEKLIELLNEYDPYIASDGEHRDNIWWYAYQGHSAIFPKELAESYIVSARYGFIKWLVENKKIAYDIPNNSDLYRAFELACISLDNADYITMLLAIQDEPIRFLCEILK